VHWRIYPRGFSDQINAQQIYAVALTQDDILGLDRCTDAMDLIFNSSLFEKEQVLKKSGAYPGLAA